MRKLGDRLTVLVQLHPDYMFTIFWYRKPISKIVMLRLIDKIPDTRFYV